MIGKWNKSVILSYIGLCFSILGMILIIEKIPIKYAIVCLMMAGICDLFDGTIARRCKRTKEEKLFGIELDSLIDVINFIAFPLILITSIKNNHLYFCPIYILYAIFGVARLAHFNITTEDINNPRKYYEGLPVTYVALIYPLVFLCSYLLKENIFSYLIESITFIISILFIIKVKIPKPKLISSILLLILSIVLSIIYLFVL